MSPLSDRTPGRALRLCAGARNLAPRLYARARERAPRLSALGLWLLVALQLAIPSAYYFRQHDEDDERFAWRMFSATRFRTCNVEAFEADRAGAHALNLSHELHASWIGLLRRGRSSVIEKFLASRCERPQRTSAWLLRSCKEVGGRDLPRERFRFDCGTLALSRGSPSP